MADTIWTNGNGDRDLNQTLNWLGSPPAANGRVYFISDNSGSGTGPNTDMATLTAIDVDLIEIREGYTEDIGGVGNDFDMSADKIFNRGAGKLWWKDGGGITDWIIADSTAASPTTSIMNVTGDKTVRLTVLRGGVTVDANGTVDNVEIGRRESGAHDAHLTITAGASMINAKQYAGVTTSSAAMTLLDMCNGRWTQDTATITTLNIYGGNFIFKFAGIIGTVNHYGGTIDVTQGGGVKTFTNYYKYPGAVLIGENSGMVDITNGFYATS